MSEEFFTDYKDGDIVWVKLGSSWWPGEVKDLSNIPTDAIEFKKPPLAVVKFFEEDTYEYVRNWSNIYPYNSEKKVEFIKKGMAAFRSKASHMEKFPKDVTTAEVKEGGNPNILSEPAYRHEKKRSYMEEIFGTPSPKKTPKDSSKKSRSSFKHNPKDTAHVTHRRFLGVDDYKAYICIQYPGKDKIPGDSDDEEIIRLNREPEQEYNCHSCHYSTKRLEVMILHTKSHIQGVYVSSPRRKRPVTGRSKKKEYTKKRLTTYSDNSSSDELISPPKEKKRKTKIATPKQPVSIIEEKPKVTDIRNDLLAEWEDSDYEFDNSIFDDTPKVSESLNTTFSEKESDVDKNENDKPEEPIENDKPEEPIENDKPEEPIENDEPEEPKENDKPEENDNKDASDVEAASKEVLMDKETRDAIKSCFDFDEDDEEDVLINTTVEIGRKIPRVIPPSEKRKSELLEDIIDLEESINKDEILKESQSFNERTISKDKDELEHAFKDLMDTTVVPKLPEIENAIKPAQNFHVVTTIKFPDKPDEAPKKDREKPSTDIPLKKRFLKSFEDFENQLLEESRRKEEALQKAKIMLQEEGCFSQSRIKESSTIKPSDSSDDDTQGIDLSRLQTSIMTKIIEEAKIPFESRNRIMSKMKNKSSFTRSKEEQVKEAFKTSIKNPVIPEENIFTDYIASRKGKRLPPKRISSPMEEKPRFKIKSTANKSSASKNEHKTFTTNKEERLHPVHIRKIPKSLIPQRKTSTNDKNEDKTSKPSNRNYYNREETLHSHTKDKIEVKDTNEDKTVTEESYENITGNNSRFTYPTNNEDTIKDTINDFNKLNEEEKSLPFNEKPFAQIESLQQNKITEEDKSLQQIEGINSPSQGMLTTDDKHEEEIQPELESPMAEAEMPPIVFKEEIVTQETEPVHKFTSDMIAEVQPVEDTVIVPQEEDKTIKVPFKKSRWSRRSSSSKNIEYPQNISLPVKINKSLVFKITHKDDVNSIEDIDKKELDECPTSVYKNEPSSIEDKPREDTDVEETHSDQLKSPSLQFEAFSVPLEDTNNEPVSKPNKRKKGRRKSSRFTLKKKRKYSRESEERENENLEADFDVKDDDVTSTITQNASLNKEDDTVEDRQEFSKISDTREDITEMSSETGCTSNNATLIVEYELQSKSDPYENVTSSKPSTVMSIEDVKEFQRISDNHKNVSKQSAIVDNYENVTTSEPFELTDIRERASDNAIPTVDDEFRSLSDNYENITSSGSSTDRDIKECMTQNNVAEDDFQSISDVNSSVKEHMEFQSKYENVTSSESSTMLDITPSETSLVTVNSLNDSGEDIILDNTIESVEDDTIFEVTIEQDSSKSYIDTDTEIVAEHSLTQGEHISDEPELDSTKNELSQEDINTETSVEAPVTEEKIVQEANQLITHEDVTDLKEAKHLTVQKDVTYPEEDVTNLKGEEELIIHEDVTYPEEDVINQKEADQIIIQEDVTNSGESGQEDVTNQKEAEELIIQKDLTYPEETDREDVTNQKQADQLIIQEDVTDQEEADHSIFQDNATKQEESNELIIHFTVRDQENQLEIQQDVTYPMKTDQLIFQEDQKETNLLTIQEDVTDQNEANQLIVQEDVMEQEESNQLIIHVTVTDQEKVNHLAIQEAVTDQKEANQFIAQDITNQSDQQEGNQSMFETDLEEANQLIPQENVMDKTTKDEENQKEASQIMFEENLREANQLVIEEASQLIIEEKVADEGKTNQLIEERETEQEEASQSIIKENVTEQEKDATDHKNVNQLLKYEEEASEFLMEDEITDQEDAKQLIFEDELADQEETNKSIAEDAIKDQEEDKITQQDESSELIIEDKILDQDEANQLIIEDKITHQEESSELIIEDKISDPDKANQLIIEDTITHQEESSESIIEDKIADPDEANQLIIEDTITHQEESSELIIEDKTSDQDKANQLTIEDKITHQGQDNITDRKESSQKDKMQYQEEFSELNIEEKTLHQEEAHQWTIEATITHRDEVIFEDNVTDPKETSKKDNITDRELIVEEKTIDQEENNQFIIEDEIVDTEEADNSIIEDNITDQLIIEDKIMLQKELSIEGEITDQKDANDEDKVMDQEEDKIIDQKEANQSIIIDKITPQEELTVEENIIDQKDSNELIIENRITYQGEANQLIIEDRITDQGEANQLIIEDGITDQRENNELLIKDRITVQEEANKLIFEDKITDQEEANQLIIEERIKDQEKANKLMIEDRIIDQEEANKLIIEDRITEKRDANELIVEDKITDEKEANKMIIEDKIIDQEEANQLKIDKMTHHEESNEATDQKEAKQLQTEDTVTAHEEPNQIIYQDQEEASSEPIKDVKNSIEVEDFSDNSEDETVSKRDKILGSLFKFPIQERDPKKCINFNDISMDEEDEKLTDLVSDIVQKLSKNDPDKTQEDLELDIPDKLFKEQTRLAEKPKKEVDDARRRSREVEILCSDDSFKFCIQTNLTNLSRSEEISAIALATLSEMKTDLKQDLSFPEKLSETEMVAIEGNLTVMSEKDLADAQVEITTEKVISSKKPVTLSNFSMDFSDSTSDSGSLHEAPTKFTDFDSKGTEFTSRAITKELKPKIAPKKINAYDQCELLDILEGNTESEKKVVEFQTSTKSFTGDIMDFEDCIPSQIVCTKEFQKNMDDELKKKDKSASVMSTTSKLFERLVDAKNLEHKNEIAESPIKTIKNLRSKIKIPEQITKPIIADIKKPCPASNTAMDDIEDVEAFVIHKDIKKTVVEEPKVVTVKTARKTKGKPTGKANILQQTIITPAGEIIQPAVALQKKKTLPTTSILTRLTAEPVKSNNTAKPSKTVTVEGSNQDDNIFDIYNMPIVLSDQILTPETLENMPIVLDSNAAVTKPAKTAVTKPAQTAVTTTTKPVSKLISNTKISTPKQKPRILQSVSVKNTLPSAVVPQKPGKYIIVTQSSATPQQKLSKKTIVKRTSLPTKIGTSQEFTGNKIMVVTNQQGQQQRLLLTPAQQKVLGYQSPSGQKLTKAVVKTNVLQSVSKTEAGSSKTPSILSQKVTATTSQSLASTPALKPLKSSIKSRTSLNQKLVMSDKSAKTILIKNKHGQTIKKIATTEDDIDKQVAEQLEAIKASSGMQFGTPSRPDIVNNKPAIKNPPRRSYGRKQETKSKITSPITRTDPPPLVSTSKKPVPTIVKPKTVIPEEPKPQQDRPLNQLVIQDALGNQTTITEGQILALPSETVDGQPQSYMLVTLDQSGNLTPLNNEALMSLDPNLGMGGDLSNMVLQIDQGSLGSSNVDQPLPLAQPAIVKLTSPGEELQAGTSKIDIPRARAPLSLPVANDAPPKVHQTVLPAPVEASVNIESIVSNSNGEQGQQLIVTGDPIATQKFLESLSEGTTDLANIIANAEGKSILIQADGQQILINTNTDSQLLSSVGESTEGGGNPIFATQPNKSTDILAAALADTDVFTSHPKISQLSPNNALYPLPVGNVLETSLTLNSPIMTPLEIPSTNTKKIPDEEADILTQIPKNVDLPITITDPNISQTVANQQVANLMANELHTNLELGLGITETVISTVSTGLTSPGYSYSLPTLDENDISHKPFNSSMPLLNDDAEEASSSNKSQDKDEKEDHLNSESFLEEESRFTLGGGMCSSLSEPPPEMFDIPEVNSYGEKNGNNLPLSLQSTPDPKDDDTTDASTQAESSSEGSCEIPLQPKIVAKSDDLSDDM